jgi:hypothetical protein
MCCFPGLSWFLWLIGQCFCCCCRRGGNGRSKKSVPTRQSHKHRHRHRHHHRRASLSDTSSIASEDQSSSDDGEQSNKDDAIDNGDNNGDDESSTAISCFTMLRTGAVDYLFSTLFVATTVSAFFLTLGLFLIVGKAPMNDSLASSNKMPANSSYLAWAVVQLNELEKQLQLYEIQNEAGTLKGQEEGWLTWLSRLVSIKVVRTSLTGTGYVLTSIDVLPVGIPMVWYIIEKATQFSNTILLQLPYYLVSFLFTFLIHNWVVVARILHIPQLLGLPPEADQIIGTLIAVYSLWTLLVFILAARIRRR